MQLLFEPRHHGGVCCFLPGNVGPMWRRARALFSKAWKRQCCDKGMGHAGTSRGLTDVWKKSRPKVAKGLTQCPICPIIPACFARARFPRFWRALCSLLFGAHRSASWRYGSVAKGLTQCPICPIIPACFARARFPRFWRALCSLLFGAHRSASWRYGSVYCRERSNT